MRHLRNTLSLFLFSLLSVHPVLADGFEILGHSQLGTGFAYAGAVSGYGDGSSAYNNPAAMSLLERTTFNIGAHAVPISNDFNDEGSTVLGFPNIGSDGGEDTRFHPLVDLYAVHPLSDDLRVGLSLTSPFGLATEYADDHVVRYQGQFSELQSIQFGPSVSYDLTDRLSIGAGVGAIYSKAKFDSAIDFGTIGFGLLGPDVAQSVGLAPQMNDGKVSIDADDWSFAWRVGALFRYGCSGKNRIGMVYRGKSSVDLQGDANYTVPGSAQLLTATGAFANGGAGAGLTYPEQIALGATHWVSDDVALLWETNWTRWSRFEELRIQFDSPLQQDSVVREEWKNTWRHSLGVRYDLDDEWTLRTGFTFMEGTIRDASLTTPAVPLGDVYIVAVGAGYQLNENTQINIGYAHEMFEDQAIVRDGPTGDRLVGNFENYIGVISASVVYQLS
ncbi:OmpP1/FadL family transporter [bacterium]|nr:OmpP1/FadL family transporter [bacterium]